MYSIPKLSVVLYLPSSTLNRINRSHKCIVCSIRKFCSAISTIIKVEYNRPGVILLEFNLVCIKPNMPKTKKKAASSSDSDSGPEDRVPPAKKPKDSQKSEENQDNTWVLDKQRQVKVNEFRGRKLIDIREYYEKDGKTLPGKKGISLSINQWKRLLDVAKEINQAVGES